MGRGSRAYATHVAPPRGAHRRAGPGQRQGVWGRGAMGVGPWGVGRRGCVTHVAPPRGAHRRAGPGHRQGVWGRGAMGVGPWGVGRRGCVTHVAPPRGVRLDSRCAGRGWGGSWGGVWGVGGVLLTLPHPVGYVRAVGLQVLATGAVQQDVDVDVGAVILQRPCHLLHARTHTLTPTHRTTLHAPNDPRTQHTSLALLTCESHKKQLFQLQSGRVNHILHLQRFSRSMVVYQ